MEILKDGTRYITIKELVIAWGKCPHCGSPFIEKLRVENDNLGDYVVCLKCNGSFDVN